MTTFGQQKGSLLLCYFSSWLVEGAHGLDLPGIAIVSWLRLARMSTDRSIQSSTRRELGVAGRYFRCGGEERPLGLGDMRFKTGPCRHSGGHMINTRCSCYYDSLLFPKILDSLQLCFRKINRRALLVSSPPKATSPHLRFHSLPFETNSRLLSSTASAKMPLYNVNNLTTRRSFDRQLY